MNSSIFIPAGEPSGDQLAAHIMRAVNQHYQSPVWIGVGGALMQDEGLSSLVDIETMSIMGFGNAILAYQRLSALADRLVEQVISVRPKIVLTVDNNGFLKEIVIFVNSNKTGFAIIRVLGNEMELEKFLKLRRLLNEIDLSKLTKIDFNEFIF